MIRIFDVSNILYKSLTPAYRNRVLNVGFDVVDGRYTQKIVPYGAVLYMSKVASSMYAKYPSDTLIWVFEGKASIKHGMYEQTFGTRNYKGTRTHDESLCMWQQREFLYNVMSKAGMLCLKADGYEADDIIYTLALQCSENKVPSVFYEGDSDLACAISEYATQYRTNDGILVTPENYQDVYSKNHVVPFNFKIFEKVAYGDKGSDNIPGLGAAWYKAFLNYVNASEYDKCGDTRVCHSILQNIMDHDDTLPNKDKAHQILDLVAPLLVPKSELNQQITGDEECSSVTLWFLRNNLNVQQMPPILSEDLVNFIANCK